MGFTHDQFEGHLGEVVYLTQADVPDWVPKRLTRWIFPLLVYSAACQAALHGRPFDVVNVHEPHSALIARLRVGIGRPAVVVTSHGVEARGWEVVGRTLGSAGEGPSLRTRITYPLLDLPQSRTGLRHADHVLCLNVEDRRFLQERMGIPSEKVTVLTPGAHACFRDAASDRSYQCVHRLLFAGTWIPRKGTADLVAALMALQHEGRAFELVVLGGGMPEGRLLGTLPPSLRASVTCVSAVDQTVTAGIFASADAFVLPSLFEGTPLTLIEAMWSGLPIVTTATAGMMDVVEDGVTGCLVPPGAAVELAAAIARLQDDPDLASRLGRAARRKAQTSFTWSSAAASVAGAYAIAVSGRMARERGLPNQGPSRVDYDLWHARVASVPALDTPWHTLLRKHLVPARDLAGKVTLEIACGRGDLAAWCAEASLPPPRLIAADFSAEAVRITAARLCTAGLVGQAIQMDAHRLPLCDGSVDTVISCETLEHLVDPRAALAEFARVLAPGGRLFLTTPNYLGSMGAYRMYLRIVGRRYTEEGQPLNRFLVSAVTRAWVRRAGLTICRCEAVGHYLHWPGRNPIRLKVSGRALEPFALHSIVVAQKPHAGVPA